MRARPRETGRAFSVLERAPEAWYHQSMGEWRRCMDTPFYKGLDEEISEFHSAYLDPVDLVLVRTAPRGAGDVVVSRRQVLNVNLPAVFENFMERSAQRIEAWVLMVSEASKLGLPGWKDSIMADLDVDVVERNELLDSLEVMSELGFTPVSLHAERIPRDLRALSRAIHGLGIGIC